MPQRLVFILRRDIQNIYYCYYCYVLTGDSSSEMDKLDWELEIKTHYLSLSLFLSLHLPPLSHPRCHPTSPLVFFGDIFIVNPTNMRVLTLRNVRHVSDLADICDRNAYHVE